MTSDSSWQKSRSVRALSAPCPDLQHYPPKIRDIERSDNTLVELSQGGDREALDELLARHYDRVYAVCRRVAGNDADAADGCQEALLALVRGLDRFDGRASFKTWSYRVATNACLDEMRRKNRRPLAVIDDPDRVSDGETAFTQSLPDLADQVVDRLDIDNAFPQIPEEFRAPVVLRDVVGMDYAEIAETLDLAPGTVRSRIARGRRHLAKHLKSGVAGNQDTTEDRQRSRND